MYACRFCENSCIFFRIRLLIPFKMDILKKKVVTYDFFVYVDIKEFYHVEACI